MRLCPFTSQNSWYDSRETKNPRPEPSSPAYDPALGALASQHAPPKSLHRTQVHVGAERRVARADELGPLTTRQRDAPAVIELAADGPREREPLLVDDVAADEVCRSCGRRLPGGKTKPVNSVTSRAGEAAGVDEGVLALATALFWLGLGAGATSAGGASPQGTSLHVIDQINRAPATA